MPPCPLHQDAPLEPALALAGDLLLPTKPFRELERPEYFYDPYHLNGAGRAIFSRELGTLVAARLR